MGLVSEQSCSNLEERSIEPEIIPACRELSIGLIIWSPLAGGILAGKVSGPQKAEDGNKRQRLPAN